MRYRPIVSHSAAGNPFTSYGLPVEKGTTDRLCKEAGEAVAGILSWAMPGEILGLLGLSFFRDFYIDQILDAGSLARQLARGLVRGPGVGQRARQSNGVLG